jgi:hypothetical protein
MWTLHFFIVETLTARATHPGPTLGPLDLTNRPVFSNIKVEALYNIRNLMSRDKLVQNQTNRNDEMVQKLISLSAHLLCIFRH